jgi:DNA (cytosine-5)-methyltransferase 1
MKVLDLFSGIGGFSLGLERAGMTTVAFCEIEPFCRQVLAKHWPGIPIYDDVRALTGGRLRADGVVPDLICGGFPCQDISVAGRGAGLAGDRSGLWFEYLRVIEETRPRWVVIENVPALRTRGLDVVLGGLAALGYDAEWHCIPASAIGAPHRRDRVWLVAHSDRGQCKRQVIEICAGRNAPSGCCEAVANANSPWQHEQAHGGIESGLGAAIGGRDVADALRAEPPHRHAEPLWAGPAPVDVERCCGGGRGADMANAGIEGLSAPERQAVLGTGRWDEGRAASECGWWSVEPDVGRVAHGVPRRVDRLRALGNAVVPQIPELIGRAIMQAEARHAA